MSYDVSFQYFDGVGNPLESARELSSSDEDQLEPNPAEQARRLKLVNDLMAMDSRLKMQTNDFATGCWIDSDGEECGILPIELGIDSGFVCFPYSADASWAFESLRRIIAVFERHNYVAYDPQLDCLISADFDFTGAKNQFHQTRDAFITCVQSQGEIVIQPVPRSSTKKRWWKFW